MSAENSVVPKMQISHPQFEEEIDLDRIFSAIQRRWMLLALICITVLTTSVLLYFITPKKYRSTTTLQIERKETASIAVEDLFRIEGANQEYYQTQYNLLQRRGLAEKVVQHLDLGQDPVFNPARASWFGESDGSPTPVDDAAFLGSLARRLLGNLEVRPVRGTYLVEVSYVAPVPELAAKIANGVADAFIDWGVEKRNQSVGRASSFLSSQIEALKQEVGDKEAQLQAYSRRTDIVALDPQSNVILQSLEALNRDYTEALSERIEKESRYRELSSTSSDSIADTLAGGLIAQLRSDQARLERDYANKLATYKPDWPMMQELKAQIDKGNQNLQAVIGETVSKARETARTEYQTVLRREQSLAAELNRKKQEAMELNSAAVEYNNLRVEVSTRRGLLDELLRRQSETMVASRLEGTGSSNVIVVDRALVPGGPYRPSLRLNFALGLVLGLTLGVGGVFLAEYLDRTTIKESEEVERNLELAVLGKIPDVSERSGYGSYHREKLGVPLELLPRFRPNHFVSESYRSLWTALMLSRADGLKTVVVTSPGPDDGKTATVCNLAVVVAQFGRNVLVVDADLRKPRQHEIFKVSNKKGLVSYLTNLSDFGSIVHRSKIPNLYVIPSGPPSPNPAELLSSNRMREFLNLATSHKFDLVLFDSPPVLPVADPTLLGSMCDGVVLCLRAGVVDRSDAVSCRDRLHLAGVKILGAVLNAFRIRQRYGGGYRLYKYQASSKESSHTAA